MIELEIKLFEYCVNAVIRFIESPSDEMINNYNEFERDVLIYLASEKSLKNKKYFIGKLVEYMEFAFDKLNMMHQTWAKTTDQIDILNYTIFDYHERFDFLTDELDHYEHIGKTLKKPRAKNAKEKCMAIVIRSENNEFRELATLLKNTSKKDEIINWHLENKPTDCTDKTFKTNSIQFREKSMRIFTLNANRFDFELYLTLFDDNPKALIQAKNEMEEAKKKKVNKSQLT